MWPMHSSKEGLRRTASRQAKFKGVRSVLVSTCRRAQHSGGLARPQSVTRAEHVSPYHTCNGRMHSVQHDPCGTVSVSAARRPAGAGMITAVVICVQWIPVTAKCCLGCNRMMGALDA